MPEGGKVWPVPHQSLRLVLIACAAMFWPGVPPLRADGPPDAVNLDKDWRLWLDPNAPWRDDPLYLPDEIGDLARLPLNQPTGGWNSLDERAGVAVSLPATAEQFYWGKAPNKVADPKRTDDVVNFDGTYQGVSWWYRSFLPPDLQPGERLVLSFPGARLRAEVYVNGQLAGYHLIGETPFSADLTRAVLPGAPNQLAVRVTDPGGNLSTADDTLIPWGKYGVPVSHGFGGLDGGVTLAVRAAVAVSDLTVSNHTDPRAVTLTVEVTSSGAAYDGPVIVSIRRDDQEVWTGTASVQVPAGGVDTAIVEARLPNADLWDFGHPALYTARARLEPGEHTARDTIFGFRWFTAEGVGRHARFALNGHRVVIRAADSHGFWAPNGLFPDRAAAERETAAAQACGLNAIQNSRHFPKGAVLDAFDRAGLGRWCEPGAGVFALRDTPVGLGLPPAGGPIDTSGEGGAPATWFNRYEAAKVLGMVRAYRSHPSVLGWTLSSGADPGGLSNPKVFATLRRMHELDPSRLVVFKSGPGPDPQAWLAPYGTVFQISEGKESSGWHDEATADACPGIAAAPPQAVAVYRDGMYRAPDDFSYRSDNEKEIAAWGEAAAGASADDHPEIDRWYEKNNASGYDRAAHDVLADAYEKALDRYDFRKAFPTAELLFRQIAARQYFLAARLLENARLSNANDSFTLAGWESTTTDGHAGLVDALRQPKGDPAVLKAANAPALLVVRPRHYVIAKGEAATADVHLVNETNLHGDFTLAVSAAEEGGGKAFWEEKYPVHATGGERFGELLKDGIAFTPSRPGLVKVTAALLPLGGDKPGPVLTRTESLLVVDADPEPIKKTVAIVAGSAPMLAGALEQQLGVKAVPLEEGKGKVDDLLVDTDLGPSEKPFDWKPVLFGLLERVQAGSRLVVLSSGGPDAAANATAFAEARLLTFNGTVGQSGASSQGFWYFGKKHWLLDGLPSNGVLDWPYQITSGDGLLLAAPGLEAVVAFGRDHAVRVGLGAAVVPHGKGQIVLLDLQNLEASFVNNRDLGFHPVTARRILYNALH